MVLKKRFHPRITIILILVMCSLGWLLSVGPGLVTL